LKDSERLTAIYQAGTIVTALTETTAAKFGRQRRSLWCACAIVVKEHIYAVLHTWRYGSFLLNTYPHGNFWKFLSNLIAVLFIKIRTFGTHFVIYLM
jgi:hypothetical protein